MTDAACPFCQSPVTPGQGTCINCGASLPPGLATPTRYLPPGHTLHAGKFAVGRVLGEGGFGITYKGAHTKLRRPVAIKELFPEDLGAVRVGTRVNVPIAQTDAFRRAQDSVLEEARVIAGFQARCIVDVYDMFQENGTAYIVMQYLEGQTLEARIEQTSGLPLDEVRRIAQAMCDALAEMHARQYLHRDIKPANVMLTSDGQTVLIDFGAARVFQMNRTQQHTQILTPAYAAPEQWSGKARFGPYTDVFCLGVTLYHALTGAPPPNAMERLYSGQTPTWPSGNPDPLHTALQQALELREEDRPPTATAFRDLLQVQNAKPTVPARIPSTGMQPVSFLGKTYAKPESLAQALTSAWDAATTDWPNLQTTIRWAVQGTPYEQALQLMDLDAAFQSNPAQIHTLCPAQAMVGTFNSAEAVRDRQLLGTIVRLNPQMALAYQGQSMKSRSDLEQWTEAAQRDANKQDHLQNLIFRGMLLAHPASWAAPLHRALHHNLQLLLDTLRASLVCRLGLRLHVKQSMDTFTPLSVQNQSPLWFSAWHCLLDASERDRIRDRILRDRYRRLIAKAVRASSQRQLSAYRRLATDTDDYPPGFLIACDLLCAYADKNPISDAKWFGPLCAGVAAFAIIFFFFFFLF